MIIIIKIGFTHLKRRAAEIAGLVLFAVLAPCQECAAQTGLKVVDKSLKGIKEKFNPGSSPSETGGSSRPKPAGKKPFSRDGNLLIGALVIGSEIYQQHFGGDVGAGGNVAIDLAQAVAVAKLEGKQFKLFSTSEKTEAARRTSRELHNYNNARRAQYQELHKGAVDPAKIEQERAAMSKIKSEADSRLEMIRKSVETAGSDDASASALRDAAQELAETIVDLEDLDGLFRALLRNQNSISREYVGTVLLEL